MFRWQKRPFYKEFNKDIFVAMGRGIPGKIPVNVENKWAPGKSNMKRRQNNYTFDLFVLTICISACSGTFRITVFSTLSRYLTVLKDDWDMIDESNVSTIVSLNIAKAVS